MRSKVFLRFARMFVVAALAVPAPNNALAASYKVLHSFNSGNFSPTSGLVTDSRGNAYGTTYPYNGDLTNSGTVYEISPTTGYHLLFRFSHKGATGWYPQGNLVLDSVGNLYGTTIYGGVSQSACATTGCGVVFKLSPSSNGDQWTETVLYNFCSAANCADGANPQAGVIFDSAGNLYGTTKTGGNLGCQDAGPGCGTVFELEPSQSGWTESVLYAFTATSSDGTWPLGNLVFDGVGNLYGTVQPPGPQKGGSVFELSPFGGNWMFSVVYAFDGLSGSKDGSDPVAGLIFDAAGNLYGTTFAGGKFGLGTAFELTPNGGRSWVETILHNFAGGSDGSEPESSLVIDSAGSLYGTTLLGGAAPGLGTVFKLARSGGHWTESLFRFPQNGDLGYEPASPVTLDPDDNVYGTTVAGGRNNDGVVFRITQ